MAIPPATSRFSTTLTLALSVCVASCGDATPPAGPAVEPLFQTVAEMPSVRSGPLIVSLASGRIIVAGGQEVATLEAAIISFRPLLDVLALDSENNVFVTIGTLSASGGYTNAAAVLSDDRILIVNLGFGGAPGEIFDPESGTSTPIVATGPDGTGHSVTPLLDGRALVVGGKKPGSYNRSAWLFDPATSVFSALTYDGWDGDPLEHPLRREDHTATLLTDGRVLIAGGARSNYQALRVPVTSNVLFDPSDDSFRILSATSRPMLSHRDVLLENGNVLLVGGADQAYIGTSTARATIEVFDVATESFQARPDMTFPRRQHTLTRLLDGRLLVYGGRGTSEMRADGRDDAGWSAEILDRTGSSVLEVITLLTPRYDHTVATLPDGDVIVIAGKNPDMLEYYATAERVFLSRLP